MNETQLLERLAAYRDGLKALQASEDYKQVQAAQKALDEEKSEIGQAVLLRQKTIEVDGAKVLYIAGRTSEEVDLNLLKGYGIAYPEVLQCIKAKETKPQVRFNVAK